jgi:hypothetical protein
MAVAAVGSTARVASTEAVVGAVGGAVATVGAVGAGTGAHAVTRPALWARSVAVRRLQRLTPRSSSSHGCCGWDSQGN